MTTLTDIKEMNPEIRAQWLADLRDGTRIQGTGRLRGENGEQCCLDVLCEQAVRAGIINEPTLNWAGTAYMYKWLDDDGFERSEDSLLPQPVMEWAGLPDKCPEVYLYLPDDDLEDDDEEDFITDLADVNDTYGRSFSKIADLIENMI